jgi:hypothetical protein
MECKFIQHGIALSYDQLVKPCCTWQINPEWRESNQLANTNLVTWHKSPQVLDQKQLLDNGQWPAACNLCKHVEQQGRYDSMRGNGNHSYADYHDDDITLEIRPGNTCNFACQTCWPEASSRVAQYHSQAGLINIKNLDSHRMDDFEFLLPIADRIRDVVLLGGEPFYDKACLKFLSWAKDNLTANIMMFTNGSVVDLDFLKSYPGKITVIFSIDAVGRAAEYIRYGIVWEEFLANYLTVKVLPNVDVRVNITLSVYNYNLVEDVIAMLCKSWPSVVTFGTPRLDYLRESSIPDNLRDAIIVSLHQALDYIDKADIESGQQSNAANAVISVINNLVNEPFDLKNNQQLIEFITKMDRVKGINAGDYSNFLGQLIQQEVS